VTSLIAECSIADGIDGVRLVPRGRRRRPGSGWLPISPSAALDALLVDGPRSLVLARPPWSDPGAIALWSAARALDLDPVVLPADADAARWVVALAARWCEAGITAVERHLRPVVQMVGRTDPGDDARALDLLSTRRPTVIARWAARAWAPCARCVDSGGVLGSGCSQCGAGVGAAA
jgi:hypothetical protein